jgi:serine/threonine-protein kinase RsbW
MPSWGSGVGVPDRVRRSWQIDHMSTIEPNVRPPTSPTEPNVRLRLSNRPENVALVRAMLVGVAEAIGLAGEWLDDARTAVTEACNNVVLHAYEGDEGPLEVDVRIAEEYLTIVVRDAGIGLPRRDVALDEEGAAEDGPSWLAALDEEGLELGLPVIQALAAEVELRRPAGGGTEVRMEFAAPAGSRLFDLGDGERPAAAPIELLPQGALSVLEELSVQRPEAIVAVTIAITPDRLARTVLPRMVSAMAARANFSTDRLSDAQLVADAIAAQAFRSIIGAHLAVGIAVEARRVELRVGPLPVGGEREAAADSVLGKLGRVVEQLIDDHSIAPVGSAAVLALQLIDRR